ncbi:DNA-directed RNA polymerase subunit beta [Patescibacteria group bacterium]
MKSKAQTTPITEIKGRKYFNPPLSTTTLPNLIEMQLNSYEWFMKEGLKELLDEISPVQDSLGKTFDLFFRDYYLEEPKYDEFTSKEKNVTYEAPLKCKVELVNKETGEIKEQEIFLGDFPVMTNRGTFIINGIERVVVSQIIRSAGVFFTSDFLNGKEIFGAKIIPNRGAWLEIETDAKNVISVKIDRRRKVPITALLRAFGCGSDEEILKLFKDVSTHSKQDFIKATLEKDISKSEEEGLKEIYKRIRPGDLATVENARTLIHSMFFDFKRYDLGQVGRYKLNKHLDENHSLDQKNRVLKNSDLVGIITKIIQLHNGIGKADDIDHLSNRRIKAVGELIQNKFRVGIARVERIIKDRMSVYDPEVITPSQLINSRPITAVLQEFFANSQLSQFMDQTNPLSELAHKRRLSAMGPGGLSRERAGFDVRDVHSSHYGKICPIATPEGPNIGLVGHLASHARLNKFGFIETPYRKILKEIKNNITNTKDRVASKTIKDKKGNIIVKANQEIDEKSAKELAKLGLKTISVQPFVSDEIEYLDAIKEDKTIIGQAHFKRDKKSNVTKRLTSARRYSEPTVVDSFEVEYIDVSPNQIVSITTSLIPFLEHNDGDRALMGTNMQRQAVALIKSEAPLIGTGVEAEAAKNSGQIIVAENDGEITYSAADEIRVSEKDGKLRKYQLTKFKRSNQDTCINQKPIVDIGKKVKKGDILADGPATDKGELALGRNITVAFMPWGGSNFEDAIIISEKLVRKDYYTSVHMEEFSIEIRDTKLGTEIVTRDIPNVGEEGLKNLDADGVIRVGASIESGDILVGKITPKGETELTPEERLLRAIFGEKAQDVKDTSLRLPHGKHGKVVGIKIFNREDGDELSVGVKQMITVNVAQSRKISVGDKMAGRHGNKGIISKILPQEDMPFLEDGTPVDIVLNPLGVVSRRNIGQILETHLGWAASQLGYKIATPPFNGLPAKQVEDLLEKVGFPRSGKVQLYDGQTGEPFDDKTTVGKIYMMKLLHLVEDKMHSRSIGPYSLVTQQPLGGKAQFGGQRFGEMEVWALEAYGVAYTLQELLTIKSDDVLGRSKMYEAIIKNRPDPPPTIPESFNVLLKELEALSLDVTLLQEQKVEENIEVPKVKKTKEEQKNKS